LAMIERMEASGEIGPRTELIEATSGNNGIACAWICGERFSPCLAQSWCSHPERLAPRAP
jgi:cysteine synthase